MEGGAHEKNTRGSEVVGGYGLLYMDESLCFVYGEASIKAELLTWPSESDGVGKSQTNHSRFSEAQVPG